MDEYITTQTLLGRVPGGFRRYGVPMEVAVTFLTACENVEFRDYYAENARFADIKYVIFHTSMYCSAELFKYICEKHVVYFTILSYYPENSILCINNCMSNCSYDVHKNLPVEKKLLLEKGFELVDGFTCYSFTIIPKSRKQTKISPYNGTRHVMLRNFESVD